MEAGGQSLMELNGFLRKGPFKKQILGKILLDVGSEPSRVAQMDTHSFDQA